MSTATATMTIYCKAKEANDRYEADVAPDLEIRELISGLDEESYLPALAAGERWRVIHARTSKEVPQSSTLEREGVRDGDQLDFSRDSHGAGS